MQSEPKMNHWYASTALHWAIYRIRDENRRSGKVEGEIIHSLTLMQKNQQFNNSTTANNKIEFMS